MATTDEGIPIVEKEPESSIAGIYRNIAELLTNSLS